MKKHKKKYFPHVHIKLSNILCEAFLKWRWVCKGSLSDHNDTFQSKIHTFITAKQRKKYIEWAMEVEYTDG